VATHRIARQTIEIVASDRTVAERLADRAAGAGPMLEAVIARVFDRLDDPGMHRLDRLDVVVPGCDTDRFEAAFAPALEAALTTALRNALADHAPSDAVADALDLLTRYAGSGLLPWWAAGETAVVAAVETAAASPHDVAADGLHFILRLPGAAERLARTLPPATLARIVARLTGATPDRVMSHALTLVVEQRDIAVTTAAHRAWIALLDHAAGGGGHPPPTLIPATRPVPGRPSAALREGALPTASVDIADPTVLPVGADPEHPGAPAPVARPADVAIATTVPSPASGRSRQDRGDAASSDAPAASDVASFSSSRNVWVEPADDHEGYGPAARRSPRPPARVSPDQIVGLSGAAMPEASHGGTPPASREVTPSGNATAIAPRSQPPRSESVVRSDISASTPTGRADQIPPDGLAASAPAPSRSEQQVSSNPSDIQPIEGFVSSASARATGDNPSGAAKRRNAVSRHAARIADTSTEETISGRAPMPVTDDPDIDAFDDGPSGAAASPLEIAPGPSGDGSGDDTTPITRFTHLESGQTASDRAMPQASADVTGVPDRPAGPARGYPTTLSLATFASDDHRSPTPLRRPPASPDHDAIYLDHAGVALLWPLFPSWFALAGLWTERTGFTDAAAPHRAAALIDHLVTGDPAPPEPRLPLAKLLSGLPIDAVYDPGGPPTDAEAAATRAMLADAIAALPMLGRLSVAGLRRAWLARPGRLAVEHGGWVLRVERRPWDLLLDRVPWPLAAVALPWMPDPVRVEW
jgi:hypothetical protein